MRSLEPLSVVFPSWNDDESQLQALNIRRVRMLRIHLNVSSVKVPFYVLAFSIAEETPIYELSSFFCD